MINAKMTMDGASLDRVTTPRIVSTAESLTRAQLFTADPSLTSVSAYNYANAQPSDVVFPLFFSDLPVAAIAVRANWIDNVGDPASYSYNFLISDPRVPSVVDTINSTWPGSTDVSVSARADGSRLVLSMVAREPAFKVVSLEILNAASVPNACAATEVWPFAMFRYFEPDMRAISRVGDVVPPPPRPGTFTTPLSRGVSQGEDRTSASLNRGIDEITRELEDRIDAVDLPSVESTLKGEIFELDGAVTLTSPVSAPGARVYRSSPGSSTRVTYITLSGGRYVLEPGSDVTSTRIDILSADGSPLVVASVDKGYEKPVGYSTRDSQSFIWRVLQGGRTTTLDDPAGLLRSLEYTSILQTDYRMVDSETIEFLSAISEHHRLTDAILKNINGAGVYVREWLGPYRAHIGKVNRSAPRRWGAAERAGVSLDVAWEQEGTIFLHRGAYVEPHEWLVATVQNHVPLDDAGDTFMAVARVERTTLPADNLFSPRIALDGGWRRDMGRVGDFSVNPEPLVTDDKILQIGPRGVALETERAVSRGRREGSGLSGTLPAILSEGRGSPVLRSGLPLYIRGQQNPPLMSGVTSETALGEIALRLAGSEDYEPASVTSHFSDIGAAALAATAARRFTYAEIDANYHPLQGVMRLNAAQSTSPVGFTRDHVGRAVLYPEFGIIVVTHVLSPYEASVDIIEAYSKDQPPVTVDGPGHFIPQHAVMSPRPAAVVDGEGALVVRADDGLQVQRIASTILGSLSRKGSRFRVTFASSVEAHRIIGVSAHYTQLGYEYAPYVEGEVDADTYSVPISATLRGYYRILAKQVVAGATHLVRDTTLDFYEAAVLVEGDRLKAIEWTPADPSVLPDDVSVDCVIRVVRLSLDAASTSYANGLTTETLSVRGTSSVVPRSTASLLASASTSAFDPNIFASRSDAGEELERSVSASTSAQTTLNEGARAVTDARAGSTPGTLSIPSLHYSSSGRSIEVFNTSDEVTCRATTAVVRRGAALEVCTTLAKTTSDEVVSLDNGGFTLAASSSARNSIRAGEQHGNDRIDREFVERLLAALYSADRRMDDIARMSSDLVRAVGITGRAIREVARASQVHGSCIGQLAAVAALNGTSVPLPGALLPRLEAQLNGILEAVGLEGIPLWEPGLPADTQSYDFSVTHQVPALAADDGTPTSVPVGDVIDAGASIVEHASLSEGWAASVWTRVGDAAFNNTGGTVVERPGLLPRHEYIDDAVVEGWLSGPPVIGFIQSIPSNGADYVIYGSMPALAAGVGGIPVSYGDIDISSNLLLAQKSLYSVGPVAVHADEMFDTSSGYSILYTGFYGGHSSEPPATEGYRRIDGGPWVATLSTIYSHVLSNQALLGYSSRVPVLRRGINQRVATTLGGKITITDS